VQSKRRKPVPPKIETDILIKSARRCTLCFHLFGDLSEKQGQIAHLDKDRSNFAAGNLAFMCLDHHTLFDSKTSQHKNYTIQEVKTARKRLYEAIARNDHVQGAAATRSETATSQRAHLAVFVVRPIPMPAVGQEPSVVIDIKNLGPTPAYACTYQTWIEMLPVPFVDFTAAAEYSESPAPAPIYANSSAPITVTLIGRKGLTETELKSWREGQSMLCIRISLKYTDAFNVARCANFAYEINPAHVGLLPKYNDADLIAAENIRWTGMI
jgi:hypothetical protein